MPTKWLFIDHGFYSLFLSPMTLPMSRLSRIASIDQKFAWSSAGFVLAVFFGGLTLYNEFLKNHDPQLTISVLSETNVLDVRENVPELKILYGDADIKGLGQTLSVLVIRVENTGGASILNTYYDDAAPARMHITEGKIIKVEQLSASSQYLIETGTPTLSGTQSLQLKNVIMEPAENYVLKLLVLRSSETPTTVTTSGKIAGMRNFVIVPFEDSKRQPSFWNHVADGSAFVHLARSIIYLGGFIFIMLCVAYPMSLLEYRFGPGKRKQIAEKFRKDTEDVLTVDQERVVDLFVQYGRGILMDMVVLLGDETLLRRTFDRIAMWTGPRSDKSVVPSPELMFSSHARHHGFTHRDKAIWWIQELKLANRSPGGEVIVDRELAEFLIRLTRFITSDPR